MPVQGKDLNGRPFDLADFGDARDYSYRYRPRFLDERAVPTDLDQLWYDDRKARGAFGKEKEQETFLRKYLFFEQDNDDDEEWGPVRLLGRGGHGLVGLWQKRDDNNRIVDEVVLKESRYSRANSRAALAMESDPNAYPRHLAEAAIHKDINAQHPGVAPHLRKYKFFYHDINEREGRYRLYFEHCPFGTLGRLGHLYRCWDTYLPEVFVWYVFYSLAKACEALRDAPPFDSRAIKEEYWSIRLEELFCLHMDFKPDNVLLGYPSHEGAEYPSALLNDYGLSMYTAVNDDPDFRTWNPTYMWHRGTHSYQPTEQNHYGVEWEMPPDGGRLRTRDAQNRELDWHRAARQREEDNQEAGGDVIFDHSMNVYGLGQTMFELVTLRKNNKHLHRIRAKCLTRFQRNGNHQISHVLTKKPGVYSSRLRHLIHRCLDPNPASRPSQMEIMDQTRRGLRLAIKRAKRDGNFPVKVYFRDNDINEMPLGDAGFQPQRRDFSRLIESEFVDPDAPKLKLPADKYGGFPEAWSNPSWKQMYDHRNPHDRWFNGLEGDGSN
ncbi:uncharacterized protein Z520_10119 [Fonsecaea multimorphosa CBS 102226]|uniref:non-specific serine/threonine protein kinase n=1 Tax=Fonsecaea multimorphosa CBS 102226 TaxID=1442371 RepID=A0A0D2KBP5_9EURO|nr:uncharacterized protein Z520_10119 [Fonsecaea multimorphosa CBS 102226]KIX94093.1 hypothetical protein Z520_10119 [Fonsecaea multimorphosa CBS 102226]OAL19446.1 hypothetical protein AYO22_09608 [Fonsecaea multimorphosa]